MLKIDASASPRLGPALRFRAPPWLALLAFNAVVAALLLEAAPRSYHPALVSVEAAPAAGALPPAEENAWTRMTWWDLPWIVEPLWIRFSVDPAELDLADPALALSGSFSASLWINGVHAGGKGVPGESAQQEEPGPIDAVIPLRGRLRPGSNELLLKVSAFHTGYEAGGGFHALEYREFTADPRRSPKRYIIAATQTGLLAGLGALMLCIRRKKRRSPLGRAAVWSAVAAAAALSAFAAESSRVLIDYAYSWQGERQFAVWALLLASGFALNLGVANAFNVRRAPLWIALTVALAACIFLEPTDLRTASGVGCMLASAALALLRARDADRTAALRLVACIAPWPLFALLDPWQFVDNGVYVLTSVFLCVFAAHIFSDARQAAPERTTAPAAFEPVPLSIGNESIDLGGLRAAHAAGNYTELEMIDGSRKLVRASLAAVLENAPTGLMRVHRSHVVNLGCARRLRAEKGSRYRLALDNHSFVPVSRNLAGAVRRALADVQASSRRAVTDQTQDETGPYSHQ